MVLPALVRGYVTGIDVLAAVPSGSHRLAERLMAAQPCLRKSFFRTASGNLKSYDVRSLLQKTVRGNEHRHLHADFSSASASTASTAIMCADISPPSPIVSSSILPDVRYSNTQVSGSLSQDIRRLPWRPRSPFAGVNSAGLRCIARNSRPVSNIAHAQ